MGRLQVRVMSERWPFRLEADLENKPEEQIKITLKQLAPAARREVMRMVSIVENKSEVDIDRFWYGCKHGIDEIGPLIDEKGNEVEAVFEGKGNARTLSDETIALLDESWVYEIGGAVINSLKLTTEQKKKCGLLSTQPTTQTGQGSAPQVAGSPVGAPN